MLKPKHLLIISLWTLIPDYSNCSNSLLCELFNFLPMFGLYSDVNYMLYTRTNPQDGCDLQPTDEALEKCKFDPNLKTAVIIHGFIKKLLKESPVFDIKDKLLQVDNYNVVVFNWTTYTNTTYRKAAFNSLLVGRNLAKWISFLKDNGADPCNFHVIAHSLGTELTHFAAISLCKYRIGHATYLDAAAPTFNSLPKFFQPSYNDANFVESMHTSGALNITKGLGFLKPIADIDYYPNGGQKQPRCTKGTKYLTETGTKETVKDNTSYITCNHDTAYTYYLASFNKTCKFLGRICNSYDEYKNGDCSEAPVCRMGFYSKSLPNLPPNSKCYLKTSNKPPYCLN